MVNGHLHSVLIYNLSNGIKLILWLLPFPGDIPYLLPLFTIGDLQSESLPFFVSYVSLFDSTKFLYPLPFAVSCSSTTLDNLLLTLRLP